MSVLPVGFGSAVAGGYNIERSLRFNSADTAYLNRTPSSNSNRTTNTISFWFKRSALGTSQSVFDCGEVSTPVITRVSFTGSDTLRIENLNSSRNIDLITSQVFRDPSAWYHFVVAFDTTQATSSNRAKLYVNGVQVTAFSTNSITIAQNGTLAFNSTSYPFNIGRNVNNAEYTNGYMTEVNFLDGQVPTTTTRTVNGVTETILTQLGEFSSSTGVWTPKAWDGTYGTNGFFLKFADNSNTTAATLGKDSSGNGNNWTPNGFSVNAGVGNDSLVDSPTSYGSDTGVGGEVRGNYCTMNPLTVPTLPTLANGNLDVSVSATGVKIAQGTFQFPSSGKWYYECTFNNASSGVNGMFIGITSPTRGPNVTRSTAGAYFFYAASSGLLNSNGTDIVTGLSTISANEVFKVAVDIDNSKVWIGRGSIWYNSSGGTTGDPAAGTNPTFSISAIGLTPMSGFDASSVSLSMNFGQRSFNTTAPSGFKALCTQNLPPVTIGATSTTQANKYMDVTIYTGNATARSITNGGSMQPDFVWNKLRDGSNSHRLFDAVRGVEKALYSNLTNVEATETGTLTAFNSNGFSLGTSNETNTNGSTYVAWQWNAGGSNQTISVGQYATSPANVPSIASTVRANTTSGFSIVTATLGAAGVQDTVGHGLGAVPSMILFKTRSGANYNWSVFHVSISTDTTKYLRLNGTNAILTYSTVWGAALPTSTVFGVTGDGVGSPSNPFVAYCFAPVAGYSAFGSYTGNGSATDGTFVYLGFRPRFLMIKSTSAGEWVMMDSTRNIYNLADTSLYANRAYSEATIGTVDDIDFLSNGFKLRNNTGFVNASQTYIYAAFAESPFKYSLAR